MMREYMDGYRNTLNRLHEAVIHIEESASGLIDEVSPINETKRIQSLFGSIGMGAMDIWDTMQDTGWAGVFENPQRVLPFADSILSDTDTGRWEAYYQQVLDSIDPVEVLQAQLYVRESISDARRMRDEAEARRRALDAGPGFTLGTYRAREGDDLRDVSQMYYGTPTQWRSLMLYNELTTTELYAGQYVAIPRLDPASSEDI